MLRGPMGWCRSLSTSREVSSCADQDRQRSCLVPLVHSRDCSTPLVRRPVRVSDGTRTRDRLDHNQELYLLSYAHHAAGRLPGRLSESSGSAA
jgi:hypothetical protein